MKPKIKDNLLNIVSGDLKGYECAVDNVYQELIPKLCNTRLNEFITTHKLNAARKKGSAIATSKTELMRLFTHTSYQFEIKIIISNNLKC